MGKDSMHKVWRLEPLMHVIAWGLFFGFPFFFIINRNGETIEWGRLLHHSIIPFAFCCVFYLNYFILIPGLLFREKGRNWIILNIVLISIMSMLIQLWQILMSPDRPVPDDFRFHMNPGIIFLSRDIFSMMLTIGMAAAIQLSKRWSKAETARKEEERRRIDAERSRTEAELKNLRNQLNPHFLLNTLNNIYALIEFDKDKAQTAVAELSRLLRYALYDNQAGTVPLGKEVEFICNYISLMEIRLPRNVSVETHINVPRESRTPIAPMIFISLIENAFKHGISPTVKSFIRIRISEGRDGVICEITNSLHPKKGNDKSGSGIGLEQVGKRLELIYPGRYSWTRGADTEQGIYRSELRIMP